MTHEAQRIAIAEVCRWKEFQKSVGTVSNLYGWKTDDEDEQAQKVPNYPSDLNAMHEAEQTLTPEQFEAYGELLLTPFQQAQTLANAKRAISATAAQRAEAFLRTLGKWDDSK